MSSAVLTGFEVDAAFGTNLKNDLLSGSNYLHGFYVDNLQSGKVQNEIPKCEKISKVSFKYGIQPTIPPETKSYFTKE